MSVKISQQVLIGRSDLDSAAQDGLITPSQAQGLWERIEQSAAQSSASSPTDSSAHATSAQAGFNMAHVLYYFGGLIAMGAMSLFMTLGFQAMGAWGLLFISLAYAVGCLKVADYFVQKSYLIPAGIMATLAVCLVPLLVWCLQSIMGWWPDSNASVPGETYTTYHRWVHWRWLPMEVATLLVAAVMLWRYRLTFLVMPVAITLWYMSMDVAHSIMQGAYSWELTRQVSLLFGVLTCVAALFVDIKTRSARNPVWRKDFAFWLYVSGALMFWLGLSFMDSRSEWSKLGYACINVALVFVGVVLQRRIFTVLGGLGFAGYLGYLSHQLFQDSLMFPFVLTLIGLGVVYLGIVWQKNEAQLYRRFQGWAPDGLKRSFDQ